MVTLDTEILKAAESARDALLELQHSTERARADYHHEIRRLRAAGGTLAEIADALGLDHERVRQLVEPVDGSSRKGALAGAGQRMRGVVVSGVFTPEVRERFCAGLAQSAAQGHHWTLLAGLASVAILALPMFTQGFWLSLGVNIMLYAALCTAWTLFSGPTHLVSLATAAFFGVGTYSVALLIDVLPYPVLLLIAIVCGALLAVLVGLATLRLSGAYFVIFTLGLAELIGQIVTWLQVKFGGKIGLYVFTDLTESHLYWMLLGLTVVTFVTGWLINRSQLGFAMRIIGNDETVARHIGVDTARSKIILFAVSGAFIAVAGAIMAPRYGYITPQAAFSPMISFMVVVMALLGGTRRLWGPLVGVVPFTLVIDFISGRFPNYTTVIVGIAFLAIVYVLPDGVTGRLEALFHRFTQRDHGLRTATAPSGEKT